MTDIKNLILDMDGVLWHGERPLNGLAEFFKHLQERQIRFILATNNASKRPAQYVEKLARFGVDISAEAILTSGEATASYLRDTYPELNSVYIVGDEALREAFRERRFEVISAHDVAQGAFVPLVVSALSRELSYDMLAMASLLVQQGAHFYASNADSSFPSELGLLPGAGAVQAVIITATGVHPTVIGKPEPHLFQEALKRLGVPAAETVMVGDRLGTDILGGQRAGLQTALVLSGVSSHDEIEKTGIKPDYVFEDIFELALHL